MDKVVKSVLKKIVDAGYEAYVVGGFVRDSLLNKKSFDIDICTNAIPMEIKTIFNIKGDSNSYGGYSFKYKKYTIDITTYRSEIKYEKRKPIKIEYINNLQDDIIRRDFTINTICMDKDGKIIDYLNGISDLKKGLIKIVGDSNIKFSEDPLRMLRAIRFATTLDLYIDEKTYDAVISNSRFISDLSSDRIKEELSKILSSENYLKGLKLLTNTKIAKVIGLEYQKVIFTSDLIGMWSQIKCPFITFTKSENDSISKIRKIINLKRITNFELFNYGLYICIVAGQILGIETKKIAKKYKELPIKSMHDINISGKDIIEILDIEPSKKVTEIMTDIKVQILLETLKNKKINIKKYIMEKYKNDKR